MKHNSFQFPKYHFCYSLERLIFSFLLHLQIKEEVQLFYLNVFFSDPFVVLFILCIHISEKKIKIMKTVSYWCIFLLSNSVVFYFDIKVQNQKINSTLTLLPILLHLSKPRITSLNTFFKKFICHIGLECDPRASVSTFKKKNKDGTFLPQYFKIYTFRMLNII